MNRHPAFRIEITHESYRLFGSEYIEKGTLSCGSDQQRLLTKASGVGTSTVCPKHGLELKVSVYE